MSADTSIDVAATALHDPICKFAARLDIRASGEILLHPKSSALTPLCEKADGYPPSPPSQIGSFTIRVEDRDGTQAVLLGCSALKQTAKRRDGEFCWAPTLMRARRLAVGVGTPPDDWPDVHEVESECPGLAAWYQPHLRASVPGNPRVGDVAEPVTFPVGDTRTVTFWATVAAMGVDARGKETPRFKYLARVDSTDAAQPHDLEETLARCLAIAGMLAARPILALPPLFRSRDRRSIRLIGKVPFLVHDLVRSTSCVDTDAFLTHRDAAPVFLEGNSHWDSIESALYLLVQVMWNETRHVAPSFMLLCMACESLCSGLEVPSEWDNDEAARLRAHLEAIQTGHEWSSRASQLVGGANASIGRPSFREQVRFLAKHSDYIVLRGILGDPKRIKAIKQLRGRVAHRLPKSDTRAATLSKDIDALLDLQAIVVAAICRRLGVNDQGFVATLLRSYGFTG